MFVENLTWSSSQLNSHSGIVQTFTDISIPDANNLGTDYYAPRNVVVDNRTGGTIGYRLFTEWEYSKWNESGSLSDPIYVSNNYLDEITGMKGEITRMVVEGAGSHTDDLVVSVIKQRG